MGHASPQGPAGVFVQELAGAPDHRSPAQTSPPNIHNRAPTFLPLPNQCVGLPYGTTSSRDSVSWISPHQVPENLGKVAVKPQGITSPQVTPRLEGFCPAQGSAQAGAHRIIT